MARTIVVVELVERAILPTENEASNRVFGCSGCPVTQRFPYVLITVPLQLMASRRFYSEYHWSRTL